MFASVAVAAWGDTISGLDPGDCADAQAVVKINGSRIEQTAYFMYLLIQFTNNVPGYFMVPSVVLCLLPF